MQGQPNTGVAFCRAPRGCPRQVVGASWHKQGWAAAQTLQLHLTSPCAGRSASFPLLQSLRFQTRRRLGWGVNKARDGRTVEKEVQERRKGWCRGRGERKGGMQRERRNWTWMRHWKTVLVVGLGLTLGFTLPALMPTVLSLAGAHELVRMER